MSTDIKAQEYSEDFNDQQYEDDDDDQNQEQDEYDDDDDQEEQKPDDQQSSGGRGNSDSPKYIRLRGLPWSATHQEILDFLKNINVVNDAKGIHLITSSWDGKNTGEAYVEVRGPDDIEEAHKLNKASMGHRYIEVFTASSKEAKEAMRKTSSHGISFVVKLRGLPYAITEQQIEEFFNGLEIKPDREGILFVMDRRGRATGEAFVQFESQDDTEKALGRNREKIGHRYIEIFRSSLAELKRSTNGNGRPGPYDLRDRGGNRGNDFDGGRNNMRGGNDWGNGGLGMGANNTLGFGNLPNFTNSGNFGNGFSSNGGGFGNNFGNNGNNNGGFNGGNNRFNNGNNNFGNDFGDFGNFGNNRNFNNGGNDFANRNGNGNGNFGNLNNFGNNGNFDNMGGGNFGPIGGGRCDNEYFLIHMRGLPFSSYENDVFKFFDPIRPANVRINFNKKGLHSGTADSYFDTYEDAQLAMKRHNQRMGSRYIELFFDGKTKVNNGGGNNYTRRI